MLNTKDKTAIGPCLRGCPRLVCAVFVSLLLAVPGSAVAQQATICTPIAVPGAVTGTTQAWGINGSGHVVGEYITGDYPDGSWITHGFLLVDGQYTTIDYPGAYYTSPRGINDSGQIVGTAYYGSGGSGFVLTNGQFSTFAYPGTNVVTTGTGINDSGIIVGHYNGPPDWRQHGFVLLQGTFTTIDAPDALHTGAWGINDAGTVAGWATGTDWSTYSYTWTGGTATVLDPFPGSYATEVWGINSAGQIVGNYATFGFPYYSGFKLKSEQYSTPKCPGSSWPQMYAINDAGAMVGSYYDETGVRAFVTPPSPASARIRLNAFIRYEYVFDPVQTEYIFEGDNRTFCEACGTDRVSQEVTAVNPLMFEENTADGPYHSSWITQKYDWMTSLNTSVEPWPLTQEAREDWVEGWPMKVAWAVSNLDDAFCDVTRIGPEPTNQIQVYCGVATSNPLIVFAPAVDMEYEINLTFGSGEIEYELEGCHDGFPSYEVYINGVPIITDVDNGNPNSMFPPCDISIEREGVIQ